MAEVWVLNSTLQITKARSSAGGFTSNDETFSLMKTTTDGRLRFYGASGNYMDVYANNAWVPGIGDYKSVTFSEAQVGEFRAWLESNATLQEDTTVVEYLTTNIDLKKVANAIRAKGGTTAKLSFPDGVALAISNISTGAPGSAAKETWVLNNIVLIAPTQHFTAEFVSDGQTFQTISRVGGNLCYNTTAVGGGNIPQITKWFNQAYRKLTFDTPPTGDLLTWLQANGVKQPDDTAVQDTKALTITSNGTVSVTPDTPYDALKKVDVTVNVASGGGSPTDPYIEYTSLDSSGRVFTAKFRGTLVPEYAFANLAELTSVDMPDNVIAISDNGFYRCQKLQLTSLPPGITSLGDYAFSDCSKLALTSLPSGITSIGDQAFRDCSSLALTSLPSRITSIGDYTFRNCGKVALTSLPSGITSIGDFAFLNCYQLSLTTLPSGITSIGQYAFNNCPRLALTSLPSGLTSLPIAAFQYCPKLALTTFPSGLTSIGDYAFRNCTSLASITLPPALTTIGDYAFANCTGLETVRFTSTVSSIPNGVFSGCTKLSTIYVPWSQGQVANAPWGASNATIVYDYTEN